MVFDRIFSLAEATSLDNEIVGCRLHISGSQNGREWCAYISWFAGKLFQFDALVYELINGMFDWVSFVDPLADFLWESSPRNNCFSNHALFNSTCIDPSFSN